MVRKHEIYSEEGYSAPGESQGISKPSCTFDNRAAAADKAKMAERLNDGRDVFRENLLASRRD